MFDPPKRTPTHYLFLVTMVEAVCIALFVAGIMGVAFTTERHAPHTRYVDLRK